MELTQLIEGIRISNLPPQPPKNFFDITGIKNKEVINSRVLSYFLNPDGGHGFGRLFYNALLELIDRKKHEHNPVIDLDLYNGDFNITEEEATSNAIESDDKKKRIDLLLTGGESWAIIIENKLYHDVINPLHTYWDHTKQPNKIGIILSLFEVEKNKTKVSGGDICYINITHQELIDSVSKQFSFTSDYNETSLFYLKEYFKTIETHYSAKRNTPTMNKIINELIAQKEHINSLLETIGKTEEFILSTIADIFSEKGFKSFNSSGTFFKNDENEKIFFAARINDFLNKNTLSLYLVVFTPKVNSELIEKMKQVSKSVINNVDSQYEIDGIYSGKDHTHIVAYTNKNFLGKDDKFDIKFRQLLDEFFFKKDGIVDQLKRLE
jgi:hypothetical protein